jgi:hypothetical protein
MCSSKSEWTNTKVLKMIKNDKKDIKMIKLKYITKKLIYI